MSTPHFGFYFESAGRGASQGAITPAGQFFEGSLAEESLVRETGQNSIDARAGAEPVTMIFELADMDSDAIPGIEGLRQHLAQVEQQTRDSQGHDSMLLAHQTAQQPSIPVLRIGDYGTTGLTGTESIDDPKSSLSALTRGAGISADDGSRGGSFGIGSAVGPMASNMSTVLYTSLPVGATEVVFAGYSCLATHRDGDGTWRAGDGFFTDLNFEEDFSYLRDPDPVGPFAPRTVRGTDVFVLGYRKADADPDLRHIKIAFMRNFLMAIERGDLVVRGKTSSAEWELNSENIKTQVNEDPESAAFYRAIKDPTPIVGTSKHVGTMSLYINVDDTLEKTLHTITMRTPLMRIDTFKHTSIPVKYAAVLECSAAKGNTLLRALEPPQHHKWDPGRAPHGTKLLAELKAFVREGLKSRVKQQIGDQVEVKGLSKYLPAELFEDKSVSEAATTGTPEPGPGSDRESSTVRGAEGQNSALSVGGRKSVPLGVRTAANSDGDSPTNKGKNAGGPKKRKEKGGAISGEGQEGDGTARITSGDLHFRSWSDASTGDIFLVLTASEDITGDLELIALGPGGSLEDDFQLPIVNGSIMTDRGSIPLNHKGNVLTQLELKAGIRSQVRLKLSSKHRYRLGVK